MSVFYYGPGDHDAGFVGFRVTRSWNGDYRQRYFSTNLAKLQSDSDPYFKYQRLQAEYQDTAWAVESLEYQYQQFVTTNKSNTKPERGVGVHGIVIMFANAYGGNYAPCFCVSRPGKHQKRFMLKEHLFSDAWRLAVNLWADENSIADEDRTRVLENPPLPDQFKRLRHQMVNEEGRDVPVEALRPVYREQRSILAQARQQQTSKTHESTHHRKPPQPDRSIEAEISSWFQSELAG